MPLPSSASIIEVFFNRTHVSRLWSWGAVNGFNDPDTCPLFTIRCGETLQQNIFRASMHRSGGQPTTVILKVAHTEAEFSRLQQEAGLYDQNLRYLQGTVVPKCYGLFATKNRGQTTGCLVLEHCATVININFDEYRLKAMAAISEIHQAGIIHGGVKRSSHILSTRDGVRIIDFANARQVDPKCASAREAQRKELLILKNWLADGKHSDDMLQTTMSSTLPAVHMHPHQSQYDDLKRSHRPVRF
ncbi:hypothetical protein EDD85DRAFT_803290 [Armillaria nabsnona]|nr:hypothetical protein EDD85DRAFT_803290 [Armillaria nabsnona]